MTIRALPANDGNDANYFFGYMGVASALVFASKRTLVNPIDLGASYGTAKSGVGICSMGVLRPNLILKSIVPVIMAGILGIYGLIVAVILNGKMLTFIVDDQYIAKKGYSHLGAGLCCGLSSLASGLAIGIVGDAGIRGNAQQARLYIGMILILIFAEALGLYGFIVALIIASK